MKSTNKIELQGIIGSVRTNTFGDKEVIHLSVATNYIYTNKNGEKIEETTWHSVSYWKKQDDDLSVFSKGQWVHVIGRLRSIHYTASNGTDRSSNEISASTLEPAYEDIPLF